MNRIVIYKTYNQGQLSLLPLSYDDLVSKNHPVRIINPIVDHLDISILVKSYKDGGHLKAKAKEKLLSKQGIAHRKQRCWDGY